PQPFIHLRPTSVPEMMDRYFALIVRFLPGFLFLLAFDLSLDFYEYFFGTLDLTRPLDASLILGYFLLSVFLYNILVLILFQGYILPDRPLAWRPLMLVALK